MHAKPDLRVLLKWMITRSGSVITDVITLGICSLDIQSLSKSFYETYDRHLPVPIAPFNDFLAMARTGELAKRIRGCCVVDGYTAAPRNIPKNLVPFMWVQQLNHIDQYCFDLNSEAKLDCAIEVFAIHAPVARWPDFESFLEWVRLQC